jgi:hypothetical protein
MGKPRARRMVRLMVINLNWKAFKGWKIRLNSAFRCLIYPHYVLVCWEKCPDGDIDFKITHKGVELLDAIHRLKVDACEILQDICDQNDAIDAANALIR